MIDYHVHTYLCDHAVGMPDEYIRKAITSGLKEIGFSDHAPLPEIIRNNITMEPEEVEEYCNMIVAMQDQFNITVRVGFEVDYPLQPTFDTRYFYDSRVDYIIGSCHFIGDWPFDHPAFVEEYSRRDINQVYRDYFAIVHQMVASGLFDIIGHFDLVKKWGHRPTENMHTVIEPILKIAAKKNVAIEINTAGWRKPVHEVYPSFDIIKAMFEHNVPVTLGSDAHTPEEVGYNFPHAIELLHKAGYKKIVGYEKRKQYVIPL